jgi:hypothetical protein
MLSDDEIKSILESNDELMLGMLVSILDAKLEAYGARASLNWAFGARRYIQTILAFVDSHEVDIKLDRNVPDGDAGLPPWFQKFRIALEYSIATYRFGSIREASGTIFTLNDRKRSEIHDLLNKIRIVVEVMDISEEKRDII